MRLRTPLTLVGSLLAAPHLATAAIQNLRFFGVWLSPGHDVPILRFESTITIPLASASSLADNIQAMWPGLEPSDSNGVFQNVVTNQGGNVGEWYLLPFSCCSPAKALMAQMRVYPGDALTNIFALDVPTGRWFDNFLVTPGRDGAEKGSVPYGGGFVYDLKNDAQLKNKTLTATLMTIELQEQGKWNFGPVEWRNILVEANTTETKWCTDGPTLAGGQDFNRRYSTPTWNTVGLTTTCHIAQMVFDGPIVPET